MLPWLLSMRLPETVIALPLSSWPPLLSSAPVTATVRSRPLPMRPLWWLSSWPRAVSARSRPAWRVPALLLRFSAPTVASLLAPSRPPSLLSVCAISARRSPPLPPLATACSVPLRLSRLSARTVRVPPAACSTPLRLSSAPPSWAFTPRADTLPPTLLRLAAVNVASPAAAIAPFWLSMPALAPSCSWPWLRMRPPALATAPPMLRVAVPVPACSMRPWALFSDAALRVRSWPLVASLPLPLSNAPVMAMRVCPLPLCTRVPPVLRNDAAPRSRRAACSCPPTPLSVPLSRLPPARTVSAPPASRSAPR